MSLKKVDSSKFAYEIQQILENYSDEVNEKVREEAKYCAQECKKAIKSDAKSLFNGHDYANGWSYRTELSRFGITCTIYNSDHYQLTHLLEYGHQKWLWGKDTGSKTKAFPHIAPNADYWEGIFENRCEMAVRGQT